MLISKIIHILVPQSRTVGQAELEMIIKNALSSSTKLKKLNGWILLGSVLLPFALVTLILSASGLIFNPRVAMPVAGAFGPVLAVILHAFLRALIISHDVRNRIRG